MNREIIDKCLDFAEGKRGNFTIFGVKNPDFPDNLIAGTEIQKKIDGYIKEGYSERQIGEIMGYNQSTVHEHYIKYKQRVAFYDEWKVFWEFGTEVRQLPIGLVFGNIVPRRTYALFQKRGIHTVEDFLLFYVRHSVNEAILLMSHRISAEKKAELFQAIKEKYYSLLTVSNE